MKTIIYYQEPSNRIIPTWQPSRLRRLLAPFSRLIGSIILKDALAATTLPITFSERVQHIQLITNKNVTLDTIEIRPAHMTSPQVIIYVPGSGRPYRALYEQLCEKAETCQCMVVAFDYPGVCESTGVATTIADLCDNVLSQVCRLIVNGHAAKDIILDGLSLGGAIALQAARLCHKAHHPVHAYSSNSFSSLTRVVVAGLRASKPDGYSETLPRQLLGTVCQPLIDALLYTAGWRISAINAYLALPPEAVGYAFVKSRKQARDAEKIDDWTIPDYGSLHRAMPEQRKQKDPEKKGRKMTVSFASASALTLPSHQISPSRPLDPHIAHHHLLVNRQEESALEFFKRTMVTKQSSYANTSHTP